MENTEKKPIGEVNLKELGAVILEFRKTGEMINAVKKRIGECTVTWVQGPYFAQCLELLDKVDKSIFSAISDIQTILNSEVAG